MSAPDDGGPAFPSQWTNDDGMNATAPDGQLVPPGGTVPLIGMSLREYFAAKAMPLAMKWLERNYTNEFLRDGHDDQKLWIWGEHDDDVLGTDAGDIARLAYKIADAMLEARCKCPPTPPSFPSPAGGATAPPCSALAAGG